MPKKQPLVDIKSQGKVRDAIVEICKIEAEKIMDGLIEKYPKWTGKTFTNSNRGSNQYKVQATMKFGFEGNEEAEALESGAKAKPFTGTFVQNVREHKREIGKPLAYARTRSSVIVERTISVSISPGHSALTVMP